MYTVQYVFIFILCTATWYKEKIREHVAGDINAIPINGSNDVGKQFSSPLEQRSLSATQNNLISTFSA